MSKKNNNKGTKAISSIIAFIIMVIIAYFGGGEILDLFATDNPEVNVQATNLESVSVATGENCLAKIDINDDKLRVYYLDVGQGDSILIVNKGQAMLIDASTNAAGKTVVDDLNKIHNS